LGLAEIAGQALLGVAAFLMADDHHGAAAEPGEAADDGGVVAVAAIAGDFVEIGEQEAGVVESVGAAGVAGELGALPGGDVGEELALQLGNVAPEAFEFDLGNAITGELAKLFDAFFEAFDGAFFMVAVHVPERVGILTRRARRNGGHGGERRKTTRVAPACGGLRSRARGKERDRWRSARGGRLYNQQPVRRRGRCLRERSMRSMGWRPRRWRRGRLPRIPRRRRRAGRGRG